MYKQKLLFFSVLIFSVAKNMDAQTFFSENKPWVFGQRFDTQACKRRCYLRGKGDRGEMWDLSPFRRSHQGGTLAIKGETYAIAKFDQCVLRCESEKIASFEP